MPTVRGFDSETPGGFVGCLCDSTGAVIETSDTAALLAWLYDRGSKVDFNVFWNGSYDLGAILKPWLIAHGAENKARYRAFNKALLTIRICDLALSEGPQPPALIQRRAAAWKVAHDADSKPEVFRIITGDYTARDGEARAEGWSVVWRPKKGWTLAPLRRGRGAKAVAFFDAMQFYSTGNMTSAAKLDDAMRTYLGRGKTDEEEGIDRGLIGSEPGYYQKFRDQIVRYCIADCKGTAELFEKTLAGFENISAVLAEHGIPAPFPAQPWSRASVGRSMLRAVGSLESTVSRWRLLGSGGFNTFVRACYHGAVILTTGVGTFYNATDFDLGSAYPAECVEFPSLDGAWVCDLKDPEFAEARFKFYKVRMRPTPRLAYRDGDRESLRYFEGGPLRTYYVTQNDVDIFDQWGDSYEIIEGAGLVCPSTDRPLAYFQEIYAAKEALKARFGKDSVEYLNVKIGLLNGIYGILAQARPREGRYTNFVYASYITSGTRKKVWDMAFRLKNSGATVLSYMTDGVLATDVPESFKVHDTSLGGWDFEELETVTVFENGIREVGGKLKKRGMPSLTTQVIREASGPSVLTEHSGPLSLKQAMLWGVPEKIGVWQKLEQTFYPAKALESSGLRLPEGLKSRSLRDWYHERWILDYQPSDHPVPKAKSLWQDLYGDTPPPEGSRVPARFRT